MSDKWLNCSMQVQQLNDRKYGGKVWSNLHYTTAHAICSVMSTWLHYKYKSLRTLEGEASLIWSILTTYKNKHSLYYHKYSLFKAYKITYLSHSLLMLLCSDHWLSRRRRLTGHTPRAALFCRSRAISNHPKQGQRTHRREKDLSFGAPGRGLFSLRKAFSTCAIIYAKEANT